MAGRPPRGFRGSGAKLKDDTPASGAIRNPSDKLKMHLRKLQAVISCSHFL